MTINKTLIKTAIAVSLASVSFAAVPAQAAAPKIEKVHGVAKYFRSHTYIGGRFTKRMAAQAGYPGILIIDKRHQIGDTYSCSLINFKRHQKAIICD